MFKCTWLKKLLGMKNECCCNSEKKHVEAPSQAVSDENIVSAGADAKGEDSLNK
jgi:hypothetical protein